MMKLKYSKDRVNEAKDIWARWYRGEQVERCPFTFTVSQKPGTGGKQRSWGPVGNPYNYMEMCESPEKAADGFIASFHYQFDTFPDCDFIPYMNPYYLGQGILAAMYGAKQCIDRDQPPFTEGRCYKDIAEAAENLNNDFEVEDTEWGKILKKHLKIFLDKTEGEIPVCLPDYQSPYGTLTKLLPNEELMIAMYDQGELVHQAMETVTGGIIKLLDTVGKWVGKALYITNSFNPIPGEGGLVMWDDYVSVINPEMHKEFCVPYNRKLYEKYGDGHLHTCGPYFPSFIDAILECKPRSLQTVIMRGMGKTRKDLLDFLELTGKKGIKLFGDLNTNDNSIFEDKWQKADDELLCLFLNNGYMPQLSGSYEEGVELSKKLKQLWNSQRQPNGRTAF
jgi:hypothetical protein